MRRGNIGNTKQSKGNASDGEMMSSPEEQARVTAGQRRINIIWEVTQALIALMVVSTFLYTCSKIVVQGDSMGVAFVVLSNIVALVIGFYFGRTNHTKMGGIGHLDITER